MSRLSGVRSTFTWDPASIASNATGETSHNVSAAKMGDFVFVSLDEDQQHLVAQGHVESDGVVSVHLHNATGGPVNLGLVTVNVVVVPKEVM